MKLQHTLLELRGVFAGGSFNNDNWLLDFAYMWVVTIEGGRLMVGDIKYGWDKLQAG